MNLEDLSRNVMEIRELIVKLQEEMKAVWRRIDDQKQLVDTVHDLALSVRDLANEQKTTSLAVTALRKDVDDLQEKPARRWDALVGVILSAMVGGVITFLFMQWGMK